MTYLLPQDLRWSAIQQESSKSPLCFCCLSIVVSNKIYSVQWNTTCDRNIDSFSTTLKTQVNIWLSFFQHHPVSIRLCISWSLPQNSSLFSLLCFSPLSSMFLSSLWPECAIANGVVKPTSNTLLPLDHTQYTQATRSIALEKGDIHSIAFWQFK